MFKTREENNAFYKLKRESGAQALCASKRNNLECGTELIFIYSERPKGSEYANRVHRHCAPAKEITWSAALNLSLFIQSDRRVANTR
ncbi:MAG: hypothetical protein IJ192_06920, partial [Clostridia bacterium]|nr:hypothetical protein [Clostridia bacterium]